MKPLLILLGLFCSTFALAQKVEVIKYVDLESIIENKENGLQVINFWATWCKPCVKELPFFEALQQKFSDDVKVVLISFDMAEEKESKVIPFLSKREISLEVKILDETDFDAFINKIDSSWSGAIPATLIIDNKNGMRQFFEKEFKEGELEALVEKHLDTG